MAEETVPETVQMGETIMIKVYKMPNGRKYQFDDSNVPAGAELVEKHKKPAPKKNTTKKSAEKPNKAKKPANKAKKAATK